MPDEVLINFVGNTDALKPAENALDGLNEKDKALAEQAKATAAAYDQRNKKIADGHKEVTKTLDDLINGSKNLDKSIIGGAYAQTLKNIQGQLQLTNKEVLQLLSNTKKQIQQGIISTTDEKELSKLNEALTLTNDQIDIYTQAQKSSRLEASNFTTQLRAIRNEILSLTEAEKDNPDISGQTALRIQELTDKYSEVQRIQRQFQIKSEGLVANNEVITGAISLVHGLAGGFAIAQGAAALFGSENEDVAKALLKVQAAMALLAGIQEVVAVLQKSSAASILAESIARKTETAAEVENTTAKEANAVATEEQVVATEAQTVASGELAAAQTTQVATTEAATVAQTGLNLAFLANPVFLVIAGVAELIGLYKIFFTDLGHGLEKQKQLNNELEDTIKINNDFVDAIGKAGDKIVAGLKSQGATAKTIRDAETKTIKDQLDQTAAVESSKRAQYEKTMEILRAVSAGKIKLDADEIEAYEKYAKDYENISKKLIDLQNQLALKQVTDQTQDNADNFKSFQSLQQARVASTIAGSDTERSVQIQTIRAIAKEREKSAEFISLTEGEKALARASDEKQIQGLQLANYQHYLKGRTDAVDAQIAIVKAHQATSDADAIASINKITNLQIAAIKRQQTEALANPTLNKGERQKIIDDANLAIEEAEKKKQLDILNIQKQYLTLQAAAVKKGSQEEYLYKLLLLENEREAAIANAGKNVDLLKAIDAKYFKERNDAQRAFNEILLQDAISRDNAELFQFGLTEQQKLALTLERLNDQQQLELSQANGNASKIKEINAKFNKETLEANKATTEAILQQNIKQIDIFGDILSKKNQAILSDPLSSESAKLIAANELLNQEQLKTDLEYDALEKEKLTLSAIEYEQRKQAIRNQEDADIKKHAATEVEIFKQAQQKKLDQFNKAIGIIQNGINSLDTSALKAGLTQVVGLFSQIAEAVAARKLAEKDPNADQGAADQAERDKIITASIIATQATIDQVFADSSAKRQQQLQDDLQALDDQKQKELDNKNSTEQQKSDIDKKYKDKERQLKIQAWEKEKQAKKEEAIINGLLAVTNALATVHPFIPAGLIAAGIAAATAAVQVAAIDKQKTPKFKKGQIDIQGPGTTTSDSIPAFLSKGESVIKADSTAKWKEALEAINNNTFEQYVQNKFIYPQIPEYVQPTVTGGHSIDYSLLAKEVAKEMKGVIPAPTSTHLTVDERGIRTIVKNGTSTTEYRNKRYSIKP